MMTILTLIDFNVFANGEQQRTTQQHNKTEQNPKNKKDDVVRFVICQLTPWIAWVVEMIQLKYSAMRPSHLVAVIHTTSRCKGFLSHMLLTTQGEKNLCVCVCVCDI